MSIVEVEAACQGSRSIEVRRTPSADWDAFVRSKANASLYLRSEWPLLARDVFGHPAFFLEARNRAGTLAGVLPLVQQRSFLGNFMTSLPFFNYGGALANDRATVLELMARARDLASELKCSYLELRDSERKAEDWQIRDDKVTLVLELPDSAEALTKRLGSKLRAQIKRADREPCEVRHGHDQVDAFYDVFCRNMHELGTPVYPKRFFVEIIRRFPEQARVTAIYLRGQPAAAAFLLVAEQGAEIPWASCRADAKPLGVNMKLYWEVLKISIESGCRTFDFGRSTVDSGPYRFKKQWGAEPVQLYWHRWERRAARTDSTKASGSQMRRLSALWQRLPLPLANALGPWISPSLPW